MKNPRYEQFGRAALLPGLAYAVELLQGYADELRAEIAEIEGGNKADNRAIVKKKRGRPVKANGSPSLKAGVVPVLPKSRLEKMAAALPEKADGKYLMLPLAYKLGYGSNGWGLTLWLKSHGIPFAKVPNPNGGPPVNAISESAYQRLMKLRNEPSVRNEAAE